MNDNKLLVVFLATGMALFLDNKANAYEISTHARLTYKAYTKSVLAQDQGFLGNLGVDTFFSFSPSNPFGKKYYDVSGANVYERSASDFEKTLMDDSNNPHPAIPPNITDLSLPGWLMRGAIREDDVPSSVGSNPQDDPYNPAGFYRVFAHFFDPVNNRPLNFGGIPAGTLSCGWIPIGCQPSETTPNWALGATNVFSAPNVPNTSRENHFTVFDAREAMYRALTLSRGFIHEMG